VKTKVNKFDQLVKTIQRYKKDIEFEYLCSLREQSDITDPIELRGKYRAAAAILFMASEITTNNIDFSE